jgi:hypothetical protein
MSMPLTINSDNQEDEEVNAEDYSNVSNLFPPDKKKSFKIGRRFSNIWKYFKVGDEVGRGHYQATCIFCNKFWRRGKPKRMTAHICNNCPKVNSEIRRAILGEFVKEYGDIPSNESDDDVETERTNIKRPRLANTLDNFFDSINLPKGRKKIIDHAVLRAFVMCGIPFSAIENPFFIELLKQLNAPYNPPSSETLSGTFLDVEVARINLRIEEELEKSKNLTLSMYLKYGYF